MMPNHYPTHFIFERAPCLLATLGVIYEEVNAILGHIPSYTALDTNCDTSLDVADIIRYFKPGG